MNTAPAPRDLADDFVLLNHRLHAGEGRDTAMKRIVEFAVRAIPGCHWAAITAWPLNRAPKCLAASHEVAHTAEDLQYRLRQGPCLTAADDAEWVHLSDVATDERWPAFGAAALAGTPVRSVLSFCLAESPQRAALTLYSGSAGAFDTEAVSTAALFAAHARVLLIHAASADKAVNLEKALGTSRQIGAAIGILMSVHKITADQAFEMLRKSSQHLNRKLHEIAYYVTQTGALPNGEW